METEDTARLIARAESAEHLRYASGRDLEYWLAEIAGLGGSSAWIVYVDAGQSAYTLYTRSEDARTAFETAVRSADPDCGCHDLDAMAEHVCDLDDRWDALDPATRLMLEAAFDVPVGRA